MVVLEHIRAADEVLERDRADVSCLCHAGVSPIVEALASAVALGGSARCTVRAILGGTAAASPSEEAAQPLIVEAILTLHLLDAVGPECLRGERHSLRNIYEIVSNMQSSVRTKPGL